MRLCEGIRIQTFSFDKNLRGWSQQRPASLKLLSGGECYRKINSRDLLRDEESTIIVSVLQVGIE
jgi:hypothetical protein